MMQELSLIDTLAAHRCTAPRVERTRVYEPVSGRWSWLTMFACCSQIFEEPATTAIATPTADVVLPRAA